MALKTTPDHKNKRKNMDPRKVYLEEEPQLPRLGNKNAHKHRDLSTIAVVNPRMIQRLPTPTNVVQSYRSPSSLSHSRRPPSTVNQSYFQPRPPVYAVSYAQPPPMPIPTMCPYAPAPPIVRSYYPDTRWCSMVTTFPVPSPMYAIPVPTVPAVPVPIYSPVPQVCPYTAYLGSSIITETQGPVLTPMPTTEASSNYMFGPNFEAAFHEFQQAFDVVSPIVDHTDTSYGYNFTDNVVEKQRKNPVLSQKLTRPLDPEDYLVLPRNLFPTARTLRVDPNPIIDQFCRVHDYEKHSLWILDLEFGVPREPVTRPIASYNVQFHSIHCKNTPGAIHPGFESCSYDFKNMFLFYYDCAVSAWYRGFVMMNADRSVANFQSWLEVPMQIYGMCWP